MRSTTMTVCRLLFVCFFCTLWGGQVMANELTLEGTKDDELSRSAQSAKDAGQKAVGAQKFVVDNASSFLSSLEVALTKAATASKSKNGEDKAKTAFDAVNETVKKATDINDTAQSADTAVKEAQKKAEVVLLKAQELTAKTADADDMKQKTAALKEAAEEAAKLWGTALEKVKSQLPLTNKISEDFQKAKTATDGAKKALESETDSKYDDVKKALTALDEELGKIKEAEKLDPAAKATETEVQAASEASTQAAKAAGELAKAAEEEAAKREQTLKPPQPDPTGGTENSPKNDNSGNTATESPTPDELNKDSSSDSSPLTLFHLSATSVFLLFARVLAVMITV